MPEASKDMHSSPKGKPLRPAEARLERRQHELWRLTFFVLIVISSVFAWLSWDSVKTLAQAEAVHLEALPVGLVVLVALFGLYVWKKSRDIAEQKNKANQPYVDPRFGEIPTGDELQHLFQMICKSQQGFRDLIDSFDDVLLALSLEGEIRAVNRAFADLVGRPFQEIIGKHVGDFLEDVSQTSSEVIERELERFRERRTW